jgi:predicted nuclease of restriction endonuclease-like (RecB) superfamily
MHPEALSVFRDSYTLEFLGLPQAHTEAELHRGLLNSLREFLIEMGATFALSVPKFHCKLAIRISHWTCSSSIAGSTAW